MMNKIKRIFNKKKKNLEKNKYIEIDGNEKSNVEDLVNIKKSKNKNILNINNINNEKENIKNKKGKNDNITNKNDNITNKNDKKKEKKNNDMIYNKKFKDKIEKIKNNNSEDSTKANSEHNIYINEEILDSEDEYTLNRIGNIDLKHYDNFDIIGYDIKGNKIYKEEENLIDEFIKSKADDSWRKIEDKKNKKVIELTDTDLKIIKRIRERKVATKLNNSLYIYENDNDEYKLYPTVNMNTRKSSFQPSKHEQKKVFKLMKYLLHKKNENKNKKEEELYDLWNDKIYDEFNFSSETKLPNILPGHMYSYNPPIEIIKNFTKNNENEDETFIPKNYKYVRNLNFYKKTYYNLYQRCLDLYSCTRTIKKILNIKKESLLPKLPSINSLKPFPEFQFIKYIMDDETDNNKYIKNIDINEISNIIYIIQCNKLYVFDILTSYNIVTINLNYYFKQLNVSEKKNKNFDNIIIKVNRAYSIIAISFENNILLFHYENYDKSNIKLQNNNIEKIYHILKKKKINESDEKNKELKDDVYNHIEENDENNFNLYSKIDENEEAEDDNIDDDNDDDENDEDENDEDEKEEDEKEENCENNDIKEYDKLHNENMKKTKNNIILNKNEFYKKTKEIFNIFNNNLKNVDEYSSNNNDVKWVKIQTKDEKIKYCVAIKHEGKIRDINWNNNGNYLSVICLRKNLPKHTCYLHHLKSMKSIKLIKKFKQKRGDLVQTSFFSKNPYFAIAFEKNITIYNLKAKLKKHQIVKKLKGIKNVTSFDVNKNESYIIASDSYKNVFIYDLDLSCTPYKKFQLENNIKRVKFHVNYNLFYSLSENAINLFYAKFFDDYITNPILLPIQKIDINENISDIIWSDKKPWIFVNTKNNFAALYT